MTTTNANARGVYLFSAVYDNSVYDNNITTSGSSGHGVELFN